MKVWISCRSAIKYEVCSWWSSFNQKNWGKNPLKKKKPVKSIIKSREKIAQVHIFISESSHTEIILAAQIVSKSTYIFFQFSKSDWASRALTFVWNVSADSEISISAEDGTDYARWDKAL